MRPCCSTDFSTPPWHWAFSNTFKRRILFSSPPPPPPPTFAPRSLENRDQILRRRYLGLFPMPVPKTCATPPLAGMSLNPTDVSPQDPLSTRLVLGPPPPEAQGVGRERGRRPKTKAPGNPTMPPARGGKGSSRGKGGGNRGSRRNPKGKEPLAIPDKVRLIFDVDMEKVGPWRGCAWGAWGAYRQ